MKLGILKIDGQPVDLNKTYTQQQINGRAIFIATEGVIPNDYLDIGNDVVNWDKYSIPIVGIAVGLKDYCSLRYEIYTRIEAISGTNYANWNSLTPEQKRIALVWCNIRIINEKGIVFYTTECGSQATADEYIGNYLNSSFSAREYRYYVAFTIFGFTYMGKMQGLKAESYARADFLDTTFIERGVMFIAEDGIEGLGDWIQGLGAYATTGLKPRIIAGEFTLGGGMGVNEFCDTLVAILYDGIY